MTLQPNRKSQIANRKSAFTLVELLVVIGIIAVLIGLLVPAVMSAMRGGDRSRLSSQLQILETALAAYVTDFGDLPRHINNEPRPNGGLIGAQSLARALFSPADRLSANDTGSPPTPERPGEAPPPGNGPYGDGVDGSGFAVFGRDGGLQNKSPYVAGGGFKTELRDGSTNYGNDWVVLDALGQPILFYSKSQSNLSVNDVQLGSSGAVNGAYVGNVSVSGLVSPARDNVVMYNPGHNSTLLNADKFRVVMGDWSPTRDPISTTIQTARLNGKIDSIPSEQYSEAAVYSGPYILWFAGPDRVYGPSSTPSKTSAANDSAISGELKKLDDVTSFKR